MGEEEGEVQVLVRWVSPYAMRAELALRAKGVAYQRLEEDLGNKSALLLRSNPVHAKIPVLLHRGLPVCESSIIVLYVDEAFPGPPLLPSHPYHKYLALFWADFIDNKVMDSIYKVFIAQGDDLKLAVIDIYKCLRSLEEAFDSITKESPYFGGSTVGYVDIILGPLVAWYKAIEVLGEFTFDLDQFPHLKVWMKAMQNNPITQVLPLPEKVARHVAGLKSKSMQST